MNHTPFNHYSGVEDASLLIWNSDNYTCLADAEAHGAVDLVSLDFGYSAIMDALAAIRLVQNRLLGESVLRCDLSVNRGRYLFTDLDISDADEVLDTLIQPTH
jgi:hypothetical protein